MKKIYINENKIDIIKEASEPITFFRFFTEVKKFIKDLLSDPINTKPSDILISHGLTNSSLRQKLQDKNIITKSENIDEPFDEVNGKMVSRYYVSYKVPKKDFKKKIRRLYQSLFETNESVMTDGEMIDVVNKSDFKKELDKSKEKHNHLPSNLGCQQD